LSNSWFNKSSADNLTFKTDKLFCEPEKGNQNVEIITETVKNVLPIS
jgi:hypothetical protein